MRLPTLAILAIAIVLCAAPASAQIDPLLFLKASQPNIIWNLGGDWPATTSDVCASIQEIKM